MIRSPKSPQAIGPDLTLPTVEQIAEMPAEQLVGVARHLGVLYVAVMARLATGAQEGRYERGAGAPIVTAQGPASGRYENPVAGTFVTDFAERRRPCGHTLRECGGPCDGCGRCGCRRSNACRQKAYRRRQKAHREDPEVRAAEIARLERWVARARGEAARMEAEAAEILSCYTSGWLADRVRCALGRAPAPVPPHPRELRYAGRERWARECRKYWRCVEGAPRQRRHAERLGAQLACLRELVAKRSKAGRRPKPKRSA